MQRRKFVIGLGSLAAGGAFTMGTGALSKTQIDRDLTGTVATDGPTAYVRLKPASRNGQHADGSGTEIALDFGPISGSGDGLNADSVNWFDHVFRLDLMDEDQAGPSAPSDYELWITRNPNMNQPGRLDFYLDAQRSNSIVGKPNREPLSSGYNRNVGVKINLDESGLDETNDLSDLFGISGGEDLFTVHLDNQA